MGEHGCCATCFAHITVWPTCHCPCCGFVLPESLGMGACDHCLQQAPAYRSSCSPYVYQGSVRDAILQWKRGGHDGAIHWLLHAAAPAIQGTIHAEDLLLPIPMPLSRMRQSGLHHTADCCRWLAKEYNCDWQWRLLRRKGRQAL
ncbi:MAG: hypothetical protein Q9M22_05875 [Mariprofundaceae bacterium]|nr:hypothetical protein [Mariprofundaceae bacterium]